MKQLTRGAVALLATVALAHAQEAVPPAEQMARFEVTLGHFEGEGVVIAAAGAEGMPWTAVSTSSWVLGGHFVQDDVRIEVMPGMPPIQFRSLTGWDRERGRYVACSLSNLGSGSSHRVQWEDEHTLVTVTEGQENGQLFVDRGVTRYTEDGFRFKTDRAIGTGPFFEHVIGNFRRAESGFDARSEAADVAMAMPGTALVGVGEMNRLAKMGGRYAMKGQAVVAPDAPPIDISGRNTVDTMFGGRVFVDVGVGDPLEGGLVWQGINYMVWDPARRGYRSYLFSNMASFQTADAHFVEDGSLVFTMTDLREGVPGAERFQLNLDERGRITEAASHRMEGAAEPTRSWSARYEYLSPARATAPAAAPAAPAYTIGSCCDRAQKAGNACPHPCCVTAAAEGEICTKCNG